MPRPRCRRLVECEPTTCLFGPVDVSAREPDAILLPVEGLEAIRLKDLAGFENVEAARRMGVSRATFERVLDQARHAVADALVHGHALRIVGGSYEVAPASCRCPDCGCRPGGATSKRGDRCVRCARHVEERSDSGADHAATQLERNGDNR